MGQILDSRMDADTQAPRNMKLASALVMLCAVPSPGELLENLGGVVSY